MCAMFSSCPVQIGHGDDIRIRMGLDERLDELGENAKGFYICPLLFLERFWTGRLGRGLIAFRPSVKKDPEEDAMQWEQGRGGLSNVKPTCQA
jgi:hypothetical protein